MKLVTQQKIIGTITDAIKALGFVVKSLEDDTEFHTCDFIVDLKNAAENLALVRGSIEAILKNKENSKNGRQRLDVATGSFCQYNGKIWFAIGELEIAMGNTRKHSIDLENAENCHKVLRKTWKNLDWATRRLRMHWFKLMPPAPPPLLRSTAPRSG